MKDGSRGWTGEENAALLAAAEAARKKHLPLKNAFDEIASALHRRPNSVRNHYYTQLKPVSRAEPAFRPFSDEETDRLLETVLLALAVAADMMTEKRIAAREKRREEREAEKHRALKEDEKIV